MSHPKIPERPHYNSQQQQQQPHQQNRNSPFAQSSNSAAATTTPATTTANNPSSNRLQFSSSVTSSKPTSGIINFGANFREHLENSLESIENFGGFKKYYRSDNANLSVDREMNLEKKAVELGVKFFLVAYSTLNSDCRTCLVPTSSINEKHGCHLATAMFFKTTGADPDMFLVPDPKTFIQLPWKPDYAWVQGNMFLNGQPAPQCPRRALINMMERAKNSGLVMMSGIEPEFTILNKDGSDVGDNIDSRQPMSLHDPLSIMRLAPLLTQIHDVMSAIGWKPYQIDHEATKCQYEINFSYADALTTADRFCFMKFMMKQLAEEHGYRITFMPVPFANLLCSNGLHINVSLWNEKEKVNLFPDEADAKLGISKLAYNFIGGLLSHVEESCAILCPTVNSYKRLNLGSWCPNTITWGGNNRTVLLRVPCENRVEHRLPDASINPHLAHAIILAAGLDGIDNDADPGPIIDFEVHTRPKEFKNVPTSLLEALDKFHESEFARECLGDDYAFIYLFMD
ncbi:hypothetical protein HELRODRAFT_190105 [Helobdella robusta]|uniref:GS catalytic domain-containing protein n=1 Tax=Helobdella robusta TaxID=6412 RepID=T1FRP5_HELRO|nr:hypothetical protein HELRODRAFT_190105 [Helobdella robusta]ESO10609.1 hypothetical protein HELRODRAFT_190105 [Helobdella robusta]